MQEYWIIPAGAVKSARNALEILHTDDLGARRCARDYVDAILAGEYDHAWGLRGPEERELSAEGLQLWSIAKNKRGAIYRAKKIIF